MRAREPGRRRARALRARVRHSVARPSRALLRVGARAVEEREEGRERALVEQHGRVVAPVRRGRAAACGRSTRRAHALARARASAFVTVRLLDDAERRVRRRRARGAAPAAARRGSRAAARATARPRRRATRRPRSNTASAAARGRREGAAPAIAAPAGGAPTGTRASRAAAAPPPAARGRGARAARAFCTSISVRPARKRCCATHASRRARAALPSTCARARAGRTTRDGARARSLSFSVSPRGSTTHYPPLPPGAARRGARALRERVDHARAASARGRARARPPRA